MSELENRITSLEESVSALLQGIKDVNHAIVTGFEKVDKNFEAIKEDIKSIRGNVIEIRGKSKATLETVEISLDNLTTEIKKINDVSGYDDIYANNKGLKIVQGK